MEGYIIFGIILLVIVVKVVSARGGHAANARLRGYGVVVDGDQVKSGGRVLGPLAGSQATITAGTSRHTLTRVVTVAGALTKKTQAAIIITCPGGAVKQARLDGAGAIRSAQAWAVRFNALAAVPPGGREDTNTGETRPARPETCGES